MAALVALKDAGFQIIDWMWRSANQMRIATALVTAKRHNELLRRNDSRIPVHKPRPTPRCPNQVGRGKWSKLRRRGAAFGLSKD